jgi:hypothetical protein
VLLQGKEGLRSALNGLFRVHVRPLGRGRAVGCGLSCGASNSVTPRSLTPPKANLLFRPPKLFSFPQRATGLDPYTRARGATHRRRHRGCSFDNEHNGSRSFPRPTTHRPPPRPRRELIVHTVVSGSLIVPPRFATHTLVRTGAMVPLPTSELAPPGHSRPEVVYVGTQGHAWLPS